MILAIDPGVTGALAVLTETGDLHVVGDLPVRTEIHRRRRTTVLDPVGLDQLLDLYDGPIVLEKMTAQGRNGSLANFSLGQTYGIIHATCVLNSRYPVLAAPQRWKRELNLTTDKKASLAMARDRWGIEHFPLEKHHNRAEAALLGHWYLTHHLTKDVA